MFINVSSLLNNGTVSNEYLRLMGNGSIGTSNITGVSQRARRHSSYINPPSILLNCHKSQSFDSVEATCEFVEKAENCHNMTHRIDYLKIMVCWLGLGFGDSFHYDILLFGLLIILFFSIYAYVLGKYFILPNILHIARLVHISSFQYGVIVMGLLMASPQLVLLVCVCQKSANGTLIISGTLGRVLSCYAIGMFTIGLFQKQVKLPAKALSSMIVFTMAALVFTVYVLEFNYSNGHLEYNIQYQYLASFAITSYLVIILIIILVSWQRGRRSTTDRSTRFSSRSHNPRGWRFLVHPLNPYRNVKASKILITMMLPFWILSVVQVPVVDREMPLDGWSKYLLCLSIVIFPVQLWLQRYEMLMFHFTLGVCVAIATCLLYITDVYKKPRFHGLCAILGAFMGFSLFHILDREMNVLLLQVTSYVFYIPADVSAILGYSYCFVIFTIIICRSLMEVEEPNLACGFVAGIVMSEMFTLLPSVMFQNCFDHTIQVCVSAHALTCTIFLVIILGISLLGAILTEFEWRRSHGWFVLLFYCFFLVNIFLAAFQHIHPFGTHHTVSRINDFEEVDWA